MFISLYNVGFFLLLKQLNNGTSYKEYTQILKFQRFRLAREVCGGKLKSKLEMYLYSINIQKCCINMQKVSKNPGVIPECLHKWVYKWNF